MRLFFIRHGKASYDAASDEVRPLLPEGIEQAEELGRILRAMDIRPSKIYTSPRLRAKETAQHIGMALDMSPEVTEACNFEFNLNKALKLASNFSDESDILFVGHNPSMSDTITEATGALVDLSTGGVACVSRVAGDRNGGAILKWLITPKLAAAILKIGDN